MHRATVSPEVMPHNSSQWSHVNARKKKKRKHETWKCWTERPALSFTIRDSFSFRGPETRALSILKIFNVKSSLRVRYASGRYTAARIDRERFGFFIRYATRKRDRESGLEPEAAVAASRNYSPPRYVAHPACIQMLAHSTGFPRA